MIIIGIVSTVIYIAIVPFFSSTVTSIHYTRVSVMIFLLALFLGTVPNLDLVELYHSLFCYTSFSLAIDSLLYLIGALVLLAFTPLAINSSSPSHWRALWRANVKAEYSLILIFSILGASIIISASDLISIYVALELQSFGLYLLACLRTDQAGSTHASLKYFLLGAISSAFILLGISIVYQEMGSTSFQNIYSFMITIGDISYANQALSDSWGSSMVVLGLLSILCGFMFKISAAPFHSWFSDVIQGVPTYTSIIIINLPKISIFTFLFNILLLSGVINSTGAIVGDFAESVTYAGQIFMVITTLFSLVLGTVAGLMQTKLKRLLAFSTISHVGFMLIGLVTGSEVSLSAIVFYLIQYTLTVILTFLALVAYENSYLISSNRYSDEKQVNYIVDLQGSGRYYKLLTFTFVLCLFSIAGIPPLTGFYAKLGVLSSSMIENISLVFMTAIICSVISAAYYLKVIKILMFDTEPNLVTGSALNNRLALQGALEEAPSELTMVSPIHSYTMAVLTAFICLFILDPSLLINCTELVALSLYLL